MHNLTESKSLHFNISKADFHSLIAPLSTLYNSLKLKLFIHPSNNYEDINNLEDHQYLIKISINPSNFLSAGFRFVTQ